MVKFDAKPGEFGSGVMEGEFAPPSKDVDCVSCIAGALAGLTLSLAAPAEAGAASKLSTVTVESMGVATGPAFTIPIFVITGGLYAGAGASEGGAVVTMGGAATVEGVGVITALS